MRGNVQVIARRSLAAAAVAIALSGCSSLPSLPFFGGGAEKPKPAELQPNPATLGVRSGWTSRIGPVSFPLEARVSGRQLALASSDGTVAMLDAAALSAVRQWIFKPALSNNKPVAVWVAVPMKFTLN